MLSARRIVRQVLYIFLSTEPALREYYIAGKADGVASQESVLHGGFGLIVMNPGREAARQETAELLRRAKAGDTEAFEQIIRQYERRPPCVPPLVLWPGCPKGALPCSQEFK